MPRSILSHGFVAQRRFLQHAFIAIMALPCTSGWLRAKGRPAPLQLPETPLSAAPRLVRMGGQGTPAFGGHALSRDGKSPRGRPTSPRVYPATSPRGERGVGGR